MQKALLADVALQQKDMSLVLEQAKLLASPQVTLMNASKAWV